MPKEKSPIKFEKTLVIPVEMKTWAALRKISYDREVSMSELVRRGIEKIINQYKK